jgi:hypothetical protein
MIDILGEYMSRIINLNNPGKIRSYNERTIAEVLRLLATKSTVDDETKDMTALLVYSLREIYASVEKSVNAWEKRGYWMKADRFLREWEWSNELAINMEDVIRNDAWDLLPQLLGELIPRTANTQVKKMTRSSKSWQGAYHKLIAEPPSEVSW